MANERLIHFGFAQPYLGMTTATIGIILFVRPWWLAAVSMVLLAGALELVARWNRWRADLQVARWAKSHGLHQVERQYRGGFVSWGWALLSFAETDFYDAVDAQGCKHRIMASYRADLLGLRFFTLAELRDAA